MPNKKILTALIVLLLIPKVMADSTPPVTNITKNPSIENGNNNWYKTPVEISLNGIDLESGIKEIYYKVNDEDWVKKNFYQTLNLIENPSFELPNMTGWEPNTINSSVQVKQDYSTSLPKFGSTSVKIVSNTIGWNYITNINNFVPAEPLKMVTASAWLKTENVTNKTYFKLYSLHLDENNNIIKEYLGSSNKITGTNDWTKVWYTTTPSSPNTIGISIEIGLDDDGVVWVDGANISNTNTQTSTNFYLSKDGNNNVQYYSIDQAGNRETTQNIQIKIDQTPPNNWSNTTVFNNSGDPDYILSVSTNVKDQTSGISANTKEYQYKVDNEFGSYDNLLQCTSNWEQDKWNILSIYPSNTTNTAYLETPKISFCDNIWSKCKSVKFKAIDNAGNESIKEYCINGPWIKTQGGGKIKSNNGINMIYSATEYNSDGIIEVEKPTLEYFNTSNNYIAKDINSYDFSNYDKLWNKVNNKQEMTDLNSSSGSFFTTTNFEINNLPTEIQNNVFNKVVFVQGDLVINTDILINSHSTLLFIVKGDTKISKNVQNINAAILTDKDLYTAYDIQQNETTQPLNLKGIYAANNFKLQRNLEINSQPTEVFTYEPKYIVNLKQYIKEAQIEWGN